MASQKKYVCAFCARAFTRLEHKQRHERSHTNEKPFHCLHCTSAFVRRDLLQRHCRTVHNIFLSSTNFPTPKAAKVPTINPDKVEPHASSNTELINILSISKKLHALLKAYDPELEQYSEADINDFFLVGYIKLSASDSFPVLKSMLRNLVNYLNYFLNSDLNEFNVCLVYSIISVGYAMHERNDTALDFFHRSWNLLVMKLIPNNNTNLINQIDILNNLFVHSYVYLSFNYDRFSDLAAAKGNRINSELIVNYLNDISFIILSNLTQNDEDQDSILLNKNMKMFWSTYILLSNYFIYKRPPKFYKLFLDKEVNDGKDLKTIVSDLSKSIVLIESDFLKEIVICTLANELNYLINFNKLLVCESKNSLHNSIILINKSIINLNPNNATFDIMKKKLVVNSPAKFNDLLNYYLFVPVRTYDWNLLIISLKEFNYNLNTNASFSFNIFISNNVSTDPITFSNNLLPLFNSMSTDINNNLGIVGFPLIFNHQFLNKSFGLFDFDSLSNINKPSLTLLVIEAYLTISKILINLYKNDAMLNNYILQCLLYLLNGNDSDFKISAMSWYPDVFRKLELIFNGWLLFINNDPNYMLDFRVNLSNFLNNYINSALIEEGALSNKMTSVSSSSSASSISNISPLSGPIGASSSMQTGFSSSMGRMQMGQSALPMTKSHLVPSASVPMPAATYQTAFSNKNFTTAPAPNPGGTGQPDGAPTPKGITELMLPPILLPLNLNKRNLKPMVPNLQ